MPKLQQPRIHDCIYRTGNYEKGGMTCGFHPSDGSALVCNFYHAERIESCPFAVKNPNKQYRA